MPSAFRRAGTPAKSTSVGTSDSSLSGPSLLGYRGVRPWTGGIHLTSTGLNDLDIILGGGQPLGTCIVIREDRWTRDLAMSLVKYWAAEAIAQKQHLIIPVSKRGGNLATTTFSSQPDQQHPTFVRWDVMEDFLLSLPRNLHWDKEKNKSESIVHTGQSLSILEEDDEDDEDTDEGLKVAWQYKKSVQEQRSGLESSKALTTASSIAASSVFCHSYDLSGSLNEQQAVDIDTYLTELDCYKSKGGTLQTQAMSLFRDLIALVTNTKTAGMAIRLLLFHADLTLTTKVLPLLMVYIRQNSLPVIVLICSPPSADHASWFSLSRSADVIMSTESFVARKDYPPPPEFRHLHGLLSLSKVNTVTAATANGGGHFADLSVSRRPAAYIYGLKRDRRKLRIPLLHIPPEDYAEGGGSVGSGVRSGGGRKVSDGGSTSRSSGGMGCASNLAGSPLDF